MEGSARDSSEKGWHRPGINFLTVPMVGEGLGSQQVSAVFVCLKLHKCHLSRLARCRVSHLRHHYFGHKEAAAK